MLNRKSEIYKAFKLFESNQFKFALINTVDQKECPVRVQGLTGSNFPGPVRDYQSFVDIGPVRDFKFLLILARSSPRFSKFLCPGPVRDFHFLGPDRATWSVDPCPLYKTYFFYILE